MEELRAMRIEELKRLYSELESAGEEEVEVLLKQIRVIEDALKNDLEVDTKCYEIDRKIELETASREAEIQQEIAKREQEAVDSKKNRIVEGIKIGTTVIGTVVSTMTSMKLAAWIIEVEKTGTIRSKAFDLVRKGMK